jgi:peptidoglycan/LPS O-acetylase OafA/YrhL
LISSTTQGAGAKLGARPLGRADSRIGGLDGLRAVAVVAVVVYHLGTGLLPGGFLGVDLFFVISGFLITSLLLGELEASGRIALGAFYLRRARRLLPGLFLVLAATLAMAAVFARDAVHQVLRDLPGALLYVSNWWALAQEQSYFELVGRGNLLGHLWSLAVEEQFYLLWPLFLVGIAWLARRRGHRVRSAVLKTAWVGAALSTAWMGWLAVSISAPLSSDPTRVYFGTDSHAMSVLVGAGLGAVWNVRRMPSAIPRGGRAILTGAAVTALGLSSLLFVTVSEYTPWLYRGGFLVAAAVFALLVAAASHPASPAGAALDNRVMRWIGERSYGIYLWHWPLFLVTRPGIDLPWSGPGVEVGRVALVLLVADLSYRYVELPVRHGALGSWWAELQHRPAHRAPAQPRLGRGFAVAGGAAAALVLGGLIATAPTAQEVAASQTLGAVADLVDPVDQPSVPAGSMATPGDSSSLSATPAPTPAFSAAAGAGADGPASTVGMTGQQVSWYGDSVSLWAVDAIREAMPGVRIDAGLNRSPTVTFKRVRADLSAGRLRPIVVMHLGTAGPISEEALDAMLTGLEDRSRVVLVNSTARFAYVRPNNALLAEVAARHPNTVVVDWRAISAPHASWFSDGLHLTAAGKPQFAAVVRDAALDGAR